MNKVDVSNYKNNFGLKNKIYRQLWFITWLLFVRPFPRCFCNKWKIYLLRIFGAHIDSTAQIYSTAKIYMPCNLIMHSYSCLGPNVDCYNVDVIEIGSNTTISQKAYLCSASHDVTHPHIPLITSPIKIADQVWIAADAFIGMGVYIGQGAVIGARSAVFKNIDPWTIVGGNPAKFIKKRVINQDDAIRFNCNYSDL